MSGSEEQITFIGIEFFHVYNYVYISYTKTVFMFTWLISLSYSILSACQCYWVTYSAWKSTEL